MALAVADEVVFAGRTSWWPLVLIAAGIALWRVGQKDGARRAAGSTPSGVPTYVPADAAFAETRVAPTMTQERPVETASPPRVTEYVPSPPHGRGPDPSAAAVNYAAPPPRERSFLGRLTIALALIAAGVTVVLDRMDLVDASLSEVLAVMLVVIAVGLVLGTWLGRARWLILVGLVLTPLVIATSVAGSFGVRLGNGLGERSHVITSSGDILSEGYELGLGSMELHLGTFADESGSVRASVGAGEVIVLVPPDAHVVVTASAGVGEILLFDEVAATGTDIERNTVRAGEGPQITLDLEVGAGSIRVEDAVDTGPATGADATTDALYEESYP